MPKPSRRGLARLAAATRYSAHGLRAAWQREAAFRQECALAAVLVPGAFLLAESGTQVAVLLLPVGLVLVAELLNSALEAAVDRMGEDLHELSGRAKDLGSAAVFVSLVLLVVVWVLVAAERIFG